uniref:Uncharacterized protein n=1 Tax=Panagrolaimus sp. PS1159 TaxID=55785 RepID=A0AC35GSF3_9BILA
MNSETTATNEPEINLRLKRPSPIKRDSPPSKWRKKDQAKLLKVEEEDAQTHLEKNLLKYFEIMTEINKKIFQYFKDQNFKFNRFEHMKNHVEICHLLATQWSRPDIKNLYHKTLDFYLQKVYPVSSLFSLSCKKKIAEYGRILTGIAFINGDYYLGLTCAVTVLELLPLDAYMFIVVSKWSCQLREFDVFHKYDNLSLEYAAEVSDIRNICRLFAEFFKITDTAKQIQIVDQLIVIRNEIIGSKEKNLYRYICLILIHNLLGHASKLPMLNVEKYGDIVNHFSNEIHLKSVMAIPDFFDTQISYAKLVMANGSVREAESNLLSALYNGILFASPFRVIQPLNALYYLKFRTINDRDKLKGLRAMIALLLGKLSDFKNSIEPYSPFRTDLLNDDYTLPAKSDSESVRNKTLVTTTPEHLPECDCFVCFEVATNGSFYAEKQYSTMLIDGLTVESCNKFYANVAYYGNRKYKKRKALLLQIALNIDEQNEKQKKASLALLTYICEASTHCFMTHKNIGEHSKEKICKNIISCTTDYFLDLRYYYLLARQLQRKTYSLDAYFWLNGINEIATKSNNELNESFCALDLEESVNQKGIEAETDEFNQAQIDFKAYQHLFF